MITVDFPSHVLFPLLQVTSVPSNPRFSIFLTISQLHNQVVCIHFGLEAAQVCGPQDLEAVLKCLSVLTVDDQFPVFNPQSLEVYCDVE
jgi:hypothetical protein